ncbi:MAG: DNA-binding domain-containing protein [Pseudomonadota bacterium]
MASLRELQRSFAAALRDSSADCPVTPAANLTIYRNNSAIAFRSALEATFPVIRARVGPDYFRQLAHLYRERFPSRSGDLHFVGGDFAAFLDAHLRDGDYAWLADLARIEWSREEALIAPEHPAVGAEVLARFNPEQLEELVFTFQPSLRLHTSPYPVFSVWLANQSENAPPVDQSLGSECGLIRIRAGSLQIEPLPPSLFSYLYALADGATLGGAMDRSGLDEPGFLNALGFVFREGLVTGVA